MKIEWKELSHDDREELRDALHDASLDDLDIRAYSIIGNDSADNWLRIGGSGYASDYEEALTEEEVSRGMYIKGRSFGRVVLWCAE